MNNAEVQVLLEVRMTPVEFERIRRLADWEGLPVNEYLVAYALGKTGRYC